MLVLLALAGAALAVDCERATTAADLEGALERAELQYSALEIDAFRAAVDAASTRSDLVEE